MEIGISLPNSSAVERGGYISSAPHLQVYTAAPLHNRYTSLLLYRLYRRYKSCTPMLELPLRAASRVRPTIKRSKSYEDSVPKERKAVQEWPRIQLEFVLVLLYGYLRSVVISH